MVLEVEDGTGKVDATSYASIVEADAYQASRDLAAWFAASLAAKEAALLEATAYLDGTYTWVGEVQFFDQALGWPRLYAYDHEGRLVASGAVPGRVKQAAIRLAGEAVGGALQPATAASSGALKRKRVGPLELEYFEGTAGSATARSFPEVDALLRGLVRGGPGGISGRVERWS